MRLAWIFLAVLVACAAAVETEATSPSTAAVETTTPSVDEETTTGANPDGPGGETEDPEVTKETVKTTTKAAAGTTVKTTTTKKPAGTTTTAEARPDVEDWNVHCDKVSQLCTYSLQVPGLDQDTFDDLLQQTNETESEVLSFEDNDLVDLQAGVTKVFKDADATVDYVTSQLKDISDEISVLESQATTLNNAVNDLNVTCANANTMLQKILAKKGSCLYRQCILKETTTTRPVTVPTVRTTPMAFCERLENKDPIHCKNDGKCRTIYESYECDCKGNLNGEDGNDCVTSVCDVFKTAQEPGLIYSPGFNGTDNNADDDCDSAQWTVKAKTLPYLTLEETEKQFNDNNCIKKLLSSDANLQIAVGKYKLKITYKTKWAQINQILNYGPSAVITYTGQASDYFHFTITETATTPAPN